MSVPPTSAHQLMRPVLWSFGEGPTFPGYTDDTRWNGFLNVSVGIDPWPYVLRELIAGADGDADRIAEYRGLPSDSSMVSLADRFTTEAVDRDWMWRFPDYPIATMMPIPQRWTDMSWHGDTAPSFGPCVGPMGEAAQVWVDYADVSQREFPDLPRFSLSRRDALGELTTIYAGDDWDAVLVHASVEALACAFTKLVALELSAEQWQVVRLVNQTTPIGTCASHDFVDANMLMLAAWEAERGNALLPNGDRARIEDDLERVNAAWAIATRCYLAACDEGVRFDAWRLTGRDVAGLAAAGEELGRVDGSDSPGRVYATGHIERDGERWIVNASNSSQVFAALFDAEAHLWSVHASRESVEAEKVARLSKPIRVTPRPRSIDLDAHELTVTIDAIEHRLVVLTQRAATTAEFSSEGLFLAESRRRLADARDKLRDASR